MYDDLNPRQLNILFYLKKQIQKKGYPPTVREICDGCNIKSTSTVHYELERLQNKNYIRKDPSKPRAIEIMVADEEDLILNNKKTVDIPVLGKVAAGVPILAVENIEDTFPMSQDFVRERDLFILQVSGESMINAGIFDGDYVIIEKTSYARNGDQVLALIDDEATIKTFYKEKDHFRLQPENDYMEPIIVNDLLILGKIVGLYRLY